MRLILGVSRTKTFCVPKDIPCFEAGFRYLLRFSKLKHWLPGIFEAHADQKGF